MQVCLFRVVPVAPPPAAPRVSLLAAPQWSLLTIGALASYCCTSLILLHSPVIAAQACIGALASRCCTHPLLQLLPVTATPPCLRYSPVIAALACYRGTRLLLRHSPLMWQRSLSAGPSYIHSRPSRTATICSYSPRRICRPARPVTAVSCAQPWRRRADKQRVTPGKGRCTCARRCRRVLVTTAQS